MVQSNNNRQWETPFIQVAPIFSGSLSAISSALIMYVILRSQKRLSTIYHRIMFGMSLADILSSASVALSTLPMPSYMPQEEEFHYTWTGTRLGNTSTCNAQGFFQFFGIICMFAYNAMLCVYYACAIAFTMQEQKIKKYIEPVLHGVPILAGLIPASFFLFTDMYNPQIGNILPQSSWCSPSRYPTNCGRDGNIPCIRGFDASMPLVITMGLLSLFGLILIVISLSLVLQKVIRIQRELFCDRSITQNILNNRDFSEKLINTKVVLMQALFYVVAFLICVSPPFIQVIAYEHHVSQRTLESFLLVSLFLLPLQGFFNFFIFMVHKIYNYRRMNKVATIPEVIRLLFFSSAHEPCFISRISIIRHHEDSFDDDDDESVEKKEIVEIMTSDEGRNESMKYCLHIMSRGLEISSNYSMGRGEDDASGDESPAMIKETAFSVHYNMEGSNKEDEISRSHGSSGLSFVVASNAKDETLSYPSTSPFSVKNGECALPITKPS